PWPASGPLPHARCSRTVSGIYVALGGNLGDVRETFRRALADEFPKEKLSPSRLSAFYRTRAMTLPGAPTQPDYWNAVCEVKSDLPPHAVLDALLVIESRFGRVRGERWAPRPLDLDLLLYRDVKVLDPRLVLPHPGVHARAFVLRPLIDLAPRLAIPGRNETVEQAWTRLDRPDDEILERVASGVNPAVFRAAPRST
ncbi:MAG: 2-amino-4-hydroxy-6-hydroxymethyldihydropteridine diphosphokinase, partial [Myxococcota bacterium]